MSVVILKYTPEKEELLKRLLFTEKGHLYTLDGMRIQSVTQVIDDGQYVGIPSDIREAALLRGTLVHALTELDDLGQLEDDDLQLAQAGDLLGYLEAWRKYKREKHLHMVAIEQRVYHCVHPSTRVLTDDLRWVPAGSLRRGDGIMGFDDVPLGGKGRARRYRKASVVETGIQEAPSYEVRLASGKCIRTTGNHKWLVRRSAGISWVRTDNLWDGAIFPTYFEPWSEYDVDPYIRGFLAGSYNGEGCLRCSKSIDDARWGGIDLSFAQREGPYLEQVRRYLVGAGFKHSEHDDNGVVSLRIAGGAAETLKALGILRPIRLLNNWSRVAYFPTMRSIGSDTVVAIRPVGNGEVVALESSTGTYITEGFGSHNSKYRYCGTPDRIMESDFHPGIPILGEIKTGKLSPYYALQTAAYVAAIADGGIDIPMRWIVELRPDGTYVPDEHKNKDDFAGFLGALKWAEWKSKYLR